MNPHFSELLKQIEDYIANTRHQMQKPPSSGGDSYDVLLQRQLSLMERKARILTRMGQPENGTEPGPVESALIEATAHARQIQALQARVDELQMQQICTETERDEARAIAVSGLADYNDNREYLTHGWEMGDVADTYEHASAVIQRIREHGE